MKKRYSGPQIVAKLRQADVLIGQGKGQLPAQQMLDLPVELINKGSLRVGIRKEAGINAVISEIWLEMAR